MNRDPHEQELLEHYRRHSDEQPSAQLDARILAAARAGVRERRPSFAERLRHWLLGTGSRQRWGVAVAGLATLGIGLSLTLRTFEEAPERFDTPVAPALLSAAPPAAPAPAAPAEAKRKAESVARGIANSQYAAPPAAKASGTLAEEATPAALMADAVAPEEPRASLLRLRVLQEQGRESDARELRQSLQRQFPKLDIDAALRTLPAKP
ncbi:hypothetical protein H681_15910 [Pseudomonas sp. ATCC 13867]|uniref:hypothetical protein n=1 Tax=Pseudomonas sp. ATCC 13867 TaxID=1294143 RepID=UPI0002C4E8BE|nr:hypothetical protein [Pseudomonas sp. ATCC 13867]AGI25050.1 hypothetical protein H681_15910 [Pseudomonas sp. ATCC 13867]